MDRDLYQRRFHEALAKAFAASAADVRRAYFDLANFYREKLGAEAHAFPTNDDLRCCLKERGRST